MGSRSLNKVMIIQNREIANPKGEKFRKTEIVASDVIAL